MFCPPRPAQPLVKRVQTTLSGRIGDQPYKVFSCKMIVRDFWQWDINILPPSDFQHSRSAVRWDQSLWKDAAVVGGAWRLATTSLNPFVPARARKKKLRRIIVLAFGCDIASQPV
jgi:hypothetical protein